MSEHVGPPQETYEAIMEATYRAFCEHGYADLTMRDIAEEFEKSRSLLHYHYDTKRELIVALVDYLVRMYVDSMEDKRSDDPRAAIERYVDNGILGPDDDAFDFWEFYTALFELRAQAHRVPEYRDQLSASWDAIHDSLAGTIRDGIAHGEFRDVDPDAYATLLMDQVEATRTRAIAYDHDITGDRETIQRHLLDPLYTD